MPFYEYECQACKFYTEVMQKITDTPLTKCPSCGKRALKKLVSAPVFRLKGAGWYETDFKSDKEGKRNLAVEREEPKPAAEESKAETKAPAAESAAKPAEPKVPSATTAGASAPKPRAAPPQKSRPAAAASSSKTRPSSTAGSATAPPPTSIRSASGRDRENVGA